MEQRYPFSRQIRLSEIQNELLRRLAQRWSCRQADVVRRLIVEAAEREGLAQTPVPTTGVSPTFGEQASQAGATGVDETFREPDEIHFDEAALASARPIWEEIEEVMAQVPQEDLATLPTDLAEQHDHYLYGTPKR